MNKLIQLSLTSTIMFGAFCVHGAEVGLRVFHPHEVNRMSKTTLKRKGASY